MVVSATEKIPRFEEKIKMERTFYPDEIGSLHGTRPDSHAGYPNRREEDNSEQITSLDSLSAQAGNRPEGRYPAQKLRQR